MSTQTHYRVCHLCEAMCGLEIVTQADLVVSIKGDKEDPFSQGYVCPKSTAIADIHSDPDRIRKPMIRDRVQDQWREADWSEALDLVASKLVSIQQQHGNNALGVYLGNPSIHNWGMLTHGPNAFKRLKTRNRFSATSVDQLPHQLVCYWMYGHQNLIPVPDIDRTELLIIVGGNPMASNGSLWSVPGFRLKAKALKQRGGKLVVIDPRRTETAQIADQHHFVRPGTDAFLLLAMVREVFNQGWVNTGHLSQHLAGLAAAEKAVQPFTLELAEQRSGIPADEIKMLAQALAHTKNASIYGRLGISVQEYGAICQWAVQLLNIICGNLDVPGGYTFSLPAVDTVWGPTSKPGHFNAWQSRVRGLPEFSGELPVSAMAEEILTPGEGQIKALLTGAGNPVLSTPNGVQLEQALNSLDFMVSIDFYLNETTRFADVILPPTSPLEHDHYDLALATFAVRNTAKYSPAIFPKDESALHDWEILSAIGERVSAILDVAPMPTIPPEMILDMGLKSGPYKDQLSFQALLDNPHGVDLGAHKTQLPERLVHQDKQIQSAPEAVLVDLERLLASEPMAGKGFQLIGRRHVRSNNSWMHNYNRLVKGKPRCQLIINPEDARELGLEEGNWVWVKSSVGRVKAQLEVNADIMAGVVSLPHGWGHNRGGTRSAVANAHPGVSANDLTDHLFIDGLSGNAALNGVPVELEPA